MIMKKALLFMAALVASALPAKAAEVPVNQVIASQVVTTTSTFILDMNAIGADAISLEIVASSATPAASDGFSDGTASSGTLTVVSTGSIIPQVSSDTIGIANTATLSPIAGTDKIVFISTANAGVNGSTIVVAGSSYTFSTAGAGYLVKWDAGSSTQTAANFVSAFNAVGNIFSASIVASTGVLITCDSPGTQCNSSYVTSSTQAAAAVATPKVTGGSDNSYFTFNGYQFTQGNQWTADVTYSSNTAISIMNAFNTTFPNLINASTPTTTSVLIAANTPGSAANNFTLTASTVALSISASVFKGGQNGHYITINGQNIVASSFTATGSGIFLAAPGATLAAVATEIQNSINDTASLNTIIIATCPAGSAVVYTTSTKVGVSYVVTSSSQAALKWNTNALLGATTASYTINTPTIYLPSHGLSTGMEVLFTTGSTFAIAPLASGTSYYAIATDANDIELSATSTGAIAGAYLTLTSSATGTTGHTFTLKPLALGGSEVLTWSVSNDGVNYSTPTVTVNNVTLSAHTLSTPWAIANWGDDFGQTTFRYLKLTATGPTPAGNGGFNTVVTGYGKRYWR